MVRKPIDPRERWRCGPDGPVVPAQDWLDLVLGDDLRAAWPKTDPELRLAIARRWLWDVSFKDGETSGFSDPESMDALARELASLDWDSDLWPGFEKAALFWFRLDNRRRYERSSWSALPEPTSVAVNEERVTLTPTRDSSLPKPTITLLMRRASSGWLVASYGDGLTPENDAACGARAEEDF